NKILANDAGHPPGFHKALLWTGIRNSNGCHWKKVLDKVVSLLKQTGAEARKLSQLERGNTMESEDQKQNGFSRRDFIKGAALAAGGVVLGKAAGETVDGAEAATLLIGKSPSACDGSQDLALINGRFLTMDEKDSVVSAVAIRNGRIAELGRNAHAI